MTTELNWKSSTGVIEFVSQILRSLSPPEVKHIPVSKGYQEAVSMLNLRRMRRRRKEEESKALSRVKGIPGSSLDAEPEEGE